MEGGISAGRVFRRVCVLAGKEGRLDLFLETAGAQQDSSTRPRITRGGAIFGATAAAGAECVSIIFWLGGPERELQERDFLISRQNREKRNEKNGDSSATFNMRRKTRPSAGYGPR